MPILLPICEIHFHVPTELAYFISNENQIMRISVHLTNPHLYCITVYINLLLNPDIAQILSNTLVLKLKKLHWMIFICRCLIQFKKIFCFQ